MARPHLELDEKEIEEMASKGCSWLEMADHFGCSDKTLRVNYYHAYKKGLSRLKHSLRSTQVEVALGLRDKNGNFIYDDEGRLVAPPNVTMLIWLGKILLGQRDPAVEIKLQLEGIKKMSKEELIEETKRVLREVEPLDQNLIEGKE